MAEFDSSLEKLAELLRHPEDLEKLGALKSDFMRKKATVDAQLKAGLKDQLEITQSGMGAIANSQQIVNQIKEEMMNIDKLCAESQNMVKEFPNIGTISTIHRNFSQVETMKSRIEAFESILNDLQLNMEDDETDLENQPNLLQVHAGLASLRDLRDEAMDQAKQTMDESLGQDLEDYFVRLDDVVDSFNEHFGLLCGNLLHLVTTDNVSVIKRLVLVIDKEEEADAKVKAMLDAQKGHAELASQFKSLKSGPKQLRGYKESFLKCIEIDCEGKLSRTKEIFMENPEKLEKALRWYFNDLNAVKQGMVPLMPKKWDIFRTYTGIYHQQLHDWLLALIDSDECSSQQVLSIIHYREKYYTKMLKLGWQREELKPDLLDDREGELVREWRQRIVNSINEWIGRMYKTDEKDFLERNEDAMDKNPRGFFQTKTLSDMWRMLKEQTQVAADSGRQDVTDGVVDEMFRALKRRQSNWQKLATDEAERFIKAPETEGLQTLQDWIVAIANDQILCIDDNEDLGVTSYMTRFRRDYEPAVTPAFLDNTATAEAETLETGYIETAISLLQVFIRLMFAIDMRPVLSEFFTNKWLEGYGMKRITSTFEDYWADYAEVLHPSLHDIFISELADALLVHYLGAVRNKGVKFRRADPFLDKIRDDVQTAFAFFQQHSPAEFDMIKGRWRAVHLTTLMLTSEKQAVPDTFVQFRQEFFDVQVGWAEAVLRSRDDFERSMVSALKARAGQVQIERGSDTIMSKVK